MIIRSGFQIYLRPRVTLNFDPLTPKVGHFMRLPRGPLVPIGIKIGSFVFKISCSRLVGRRDERTDRLKTVPRYVSACQSDLADCGGIKHITISYE